MLLLVSICITGLTTCHELLLLIIKVIPKDISVFVEHINIIRICSELLHKVEEDDMLIVEASVLKIKEIETP